ncbi:BREX system Lon protease-like protein BrxL, partial [Thiorhodococcus mannitoliphagus]|uniref:BREX system Lon protease-like protein BrxL n=1 Tax=Thiorhodococcus mannitoliphagus TaxID=329406 RepID=UPI001F101603
RSCHSFRPFHRLLKHSVLGQPMIKAMGSMRRLVSQRIKLGQAVEGRDEKGIKKTVAALLKILHPSGPPNDDEFDEYVAYATECRRRVKEQMNKRKSDDEFALINLSFINHQGQDTIVFCPKSKSAAATQEPARKNIHHPTEESGEKEHCHRRLP